MGRELRRVPMNFNAPLHKVWKGFLNPYYDKKYVQNCPFCDGSGSSPEAKRLSDQWYGYAEFNPADTGSKPYTWESKPVYDLAVKNIIMSMEGVDEYWRMLKDGEVDEYMASQPWLRNDVQREGNRLCGHFNTQWMHHLDADDVKALVDGGRLFDFTRRPRTQEQADKLKADAEKDGHNDYWMRENNGYMPTPEEVNNWSVGGMGHDSINQWVCVKAKMKRLGIRTSRCQHCKGEGSIWLTPRIKKLRDAWKEKQPPTGKGFQLWSTTSEGEPVSPVFASLDELAGWCEGNATTFADCRTTKEGWMQMLDANHVYHQEGNMVFL